MSPNSPGLLFLLIIIQLSTNQPFILFSVPLSAAVPVVKCFGTNFLILVLNVTSFLCIHKVSMVT